MSTQPKLADNLELWPLSRLRPFARNPRTHSEAQIEQIAASIRQFGFNNPILVDGEDGIVAGHGRLLAAQRLGLAQVPVVVLDHLTPEQRRAYVIADNKLAMNAGWDTQLLGEEILALQELDFPVEVLGFSDQELSELLDGLGGDLDLTDEEEVPAAPSQPVTQPGDLWLLGAHRVLCGDSLLAADLLCVLDGKQADLVFTDPPYGVAYVGKTKDALTIENDAQSPADFAAFLHTAFSNLHAVLKPGGVFYICAPAGPDETVFRNVLQAIFELRQCLVWAKDQFVMGRSDYHWQHESILYGWKEGAAHTFVDDRTQSTVWEMARPKASREHPTMKPIALVERAVRNSSLRGELVLDLFGGSGTTLLACQRSGRQACLVELDPRYVDVIVSRYEQATGQPATLADTGQTFAEVAAARGAVMA